MNMSEPISNQTCTKCQHCGQWTNYADDPQHQAGEAKLAESEAREAGLRRAATPLHRLIVSMQPMGYFTNDEWTSRLAELETALSTPPTPDRRDAELAECAMRRPIVERQRAFLNSATESIKRVQKVVEAAVRHVMFIERLIERAGSDKYIQDTNLNLIKAVRAMQEGER